MPDPAEPAPDVVPEPDPPVPAAPPGPQVTPTDRLKRALLRPSRRQVVAGLLMALVGFAAVTQVRVAGTDDTYSGLREQELIDLFSALSGTRQRTEAEIDRLEGVASDLRDDTTKRQTALDQAETEVDTLTILAGLVPVTGPGARITITEDEGRIRLSTMLDTIQSLRTVGAEAIAINGTVRVVAQTSIEETEGGFLIDGERVEAPYVIDAIGEPDVLAGAISFTLGPKKQIEDDGGEVDVRQLRAVDIEAVTDRDEVRYALPDQGR